MSLKPGWKIVLALAVIVTAGSAAGCAASAGFDRSLKDIADPYRFHLAGWELAALGGLWGKVTGGDVDISGGAALVGEYFANNERMGALERAPDAAAAAEELEVLRQRNEALRGDVERVIAAQLREAFSGEGIHNPFGDLAFAFPPIAFVLTEPPHVLVVSPRDRIETLRKLSLRIEMSAAEMASVELQVDGLGVSSLVVGLGGYSTYPSFVIDSGGLRFAIEAAAEEWLHQYLAFTPLGFLNLLDTAAIRRDYDIQTMNETLVGIISGEIGAAVYDKYYAPDGGEAAPGGGASGFDFNREMREIRRAVDAYLAAGEIETAEAFMEEKRQYLQENGYYIRKLNQAYFAFHGAYADSPTSISPIGAEMAQLRAESASLKEFLDRAASLTGRQALAESVR